MLRIILFLYSKIIFITEKWFNKKLHNKYISIIENNRLENLLVFDVGAHYGESINFFKKFKTVNYIYSFEPSKKNFLHLKNYFGFYEDVKLNNCGVGDLEGVYEFYESSITEMSSLIPPNSNGLRQKLKSILFKPRSEADFSYAVETTTLDAEFKKYNFLNQNIVLKIDTEGYELKVLMGAREFLKSSNTFILQIEIHRDKTRKHLESEIHKFLTDLKFKKCYVLSHYMDPTVKDVIYISDNLKTIE